MWEVTVLVIGRHKLPRYSCLNLQSLYKYMCVYILCRGMKNWVYRRKMDTRDELLARLLVAAARIKKRDGKLRRTIRYLHTRVAKFIKIEGGIFEL
jgi:hypothetical protein